MPFFRVSFLAEIPEPGMMRNSERSYEYLFKNIRLLFLRTIDYCFHIVFGNFSNLIIPKSGIKIQFFFLNRLWRFLKNGHFPVKLHSSATWVEFNDHRECQIERACCQRT